LPFTKQRERDRGEREKERPITLAAGFSWLLSSSEELSLLFSSFFRFAGAGLAAGLAGVVGLDVGAVGFSSLLLSSTLSLLLS
jgi:hypothetical protein